MFTKMVNRAWQGLICLIWALLIKISKKGGGDMMAMFFAQRVILGKANFSANFGDQGYIPPALRQQVATILIESGLPELAPAEYGGTGG